MSASRADQIRWSSSEALGSLLFQPALRPPRSAAIRNPGARRSFWDRNFVENSPPDPAMVRAEVRTSCLESLDAADPLCFTCKPDSRFTSDSISRPALGRIWMLASRETADCHSRLVWPIRTAPSCGQRGKKGHDRHDRDQCAPGNARSRHERRLLAAGKPRSACPLKGAHALRSNLSIAQSYMCSRPSPSTSLRAPSNWSINPRSCVATTTDVPDRCNSTKRRTSRLAMVGSTLPVGSSASSNSGRTIRARAIAARCFRRRKGPR